MGRLAFVLAVLALGGAGWAVYQVERARTEADREALDAMSLRLAAIERGIAEINARPHPVAPLEARPAVATTAQPANGEPGATTAPSLSAPGRTRASMEERLAALEKTLADKRAAPFSLDGLRHEVDGDARPFMTMPGFWPDVDSAAKALKLDEGTKARLENIVEATKRDLDNLYGRANDEGVLWKDVNEELKLEGIEPGELVSKLGEHMQKVAKFKNGKVPGTNETYGEAERRIVKDGRSRARSVLDPDQVKVWDKSHPDALFGAQLGGESLGAVTVFSAPGVEFTTPTPSR